VKAILTDTEWLPVPMGNRADFGKLQEPALYIISMLRGLEATVADHPFMADLSTEMGQRVFYSPSVFNYFAPGTGFRARTPTPRSSRYYRRLRR
jgi:uncharacterized protein (DUF1800 family)